MSPVTQTSAEAVAYQTLIERLLAHDASYESEVAEQAAERDARIQAAQNHYDDRRQKLEALASRVSSVCQKTADFAAHVQANPIPPKEAVRLEDCDRIESEREKAEAKWNNACRDHAQLDQIQRFDEATRSAYSTNRVLQLVAILTPAGIAAAIFVRAALMPTGG